jgi:hypothetical protein
MLQPDDLATVGVRERAEQSRVFPRSWRGWLWIAPRDAECFGLEAPLARWRELRDRMHATIC